MCNATYYASVPYSLGRRVGLTLRGSKSLRSSLPSLMSSVSADAPAQLTSRDVNIQDTVEHTVRHAVVGLALGRAKEGEGGREEDEAVVRAKDHNQQVHAEVKHLKRVFKTSIALDTTTNLEDLRHGERQHNNAGKLGAHDAADNVAAHLGQRVVCTLLV